MDLRKPVKRLCLKREERGLKTGLFESVFSVADTKSRRPRRVDARLRTEQNSSRPERFGAMTW